jgi:N-acetylmuramic acid 6-phosphate etherase
MAAGAALRAALCSISTTVMTRLGRTYKGLMVDMVVSNNKLRQRAIGIVSKITAKPAIEAERALQESEFNIKLAVLLLHDGVDSLPSTNKLLRENQDSLSKALSVV